ncbi:MAG: hypothetical protein IEMM0006_0936 [bacterium]|nr:MAG: hypothetical protein IEMM0006_0936 [bacterium]
MKINKENYGRFIIDFYDGQLSPHEEQMLVLFLEQNPELKKEFENFEDLPVVQDKLWKFPEKELLKKPEIKTVGEITEDNFDEYFVLSQDGELTTEGQKSAEAFLQQNPHLQEEFRQLSLAKIIPDETIVFENKELLKQHRVVPLLRYAGLTIAAVLLLFFGIRFFLSSPGQKIKSRQLAVESIPLKTTKLPVTEVYPQLISKKFSILKNRNKKIKTVRKVIRETPPKSIQMLASADVYQPLKMKKDYIPLLFPEGNVEMEKMELSSPVIVEQPVRNNFLRHTIGKPFSQLATIFALQKKKRKLSGNHDKGFVKILERGVDAMNALTDNDIVMVKTYDRNGNLIDYQLLSDNFSINRQVKTSLNR